MYLKNLIIVTLIFGLSACSNNPPKPPEPKGKTTPVNPLNIPVQDLKR